MQSPRVYFNNIGSICTYSLRHGNGLSALLVLTRAAKKVARLKAARLKHARINNERTDILTYSGDSWRRTEHTHSSLVAPPGGEPNTHSPLVANHGGVQSTEM